MNLIQKYGTDVSLEEEGVWVDYGDGVEVKIARWGNSTFRRVYARLTRPYKEQMRRESLAPEIDKRIMDQVIAESIVLDWKGVDLGHGEIPHNQAAALEVMARKDLKDFRADIVTASQAAETFRIEEIEEDSKNLPTTSDGNSGSEDTKPPPENE